MRMEKAKRVAALAVLLFSLLVVALPGDIFAQSTGSQQQPAKSSFSYTEGPSIFKAYSYR